MIRISEEVKLAIEAKQPVVALESTIISHGMPYPENIKTALECEAIIRQNGSIPATIAIIDGVITVGLSVSEIEKIALPDAVVMKVSRRDIPYAISQKLNGALTVAATMICADLAGIRFFATGGIGGVHRNAEVSMDISADLEELKETSVCVVSAGVKSILDIEKTLEYLETKGVPVIGYRTDQMPAFYTTESEYAIPSRLDTPEAISDFVRVKWNLPLNGGVLVCNPIPKTASFPKADIDKAISSALNEAQYLGITGKAITPFLLKKIVELTEGKSLQSNIQLVFNNCRLASQIAKAYYRKD